MISRNLADIWQKGNVVSVGASGALMGLLGAIISYIAFNWKDLPDASQVYRLLVLLLLINVPSEDV